MCQIFGTRRQKHQSPELNPLTNPVLEQNLGRWAKIYFSTPPAKREQAVNNLLEEISRESGGPPDPAVRILQPIQNSSVRFAPLANITILPVTSSAAGAGKSWIRDSPLRRKIGLGPQQLKYFRLTPPTAMQWMREQTFSGLTDAYAPRKRGWKYAVGAAVIVLAGFAYMRWAPDSWTKIPATRAPQVSAPATALPPQNAFVSRSPS